MRKDVSDGVAHLVRTGQADPRSIAIFGGSHGGYAALSGLAFEPDTYVAGISLFLFEDE